ncbi:Rpn family recombination-promoting nuclease/putative transposase [Anaerobutyricum hallii]|uniref:Rpn family recombination-promoting nuclease/putative transposase n=1 Tax=Anaerobutyricum hallii TaxID=39488 RepID=UPI0026EC563E|nr:Rpn family recombination-promoting nuclease/putative transposase [Anaerobutyricum hallii]
MSDFDLIEKHNKHLEFIKQLRLIDDIFMEKVFGEDIACTQLLIQIILGKKDLKVTKINKQLPLSNLHGRSVRLDVFAVDTNDTLYNIEVQRGDSGAVSKRARYNSSMLDANITESGDDYSALKETYVIFITENDVLKGGLPIYHVERAILETGKLFNDKAHIIYVNSQIQNNTELGRLMHDFYCTDARQMYYPTLAQRVKYLKEDYEGVNTMCEAVREFFKDELAAGEALSRAKGRAEGREEGRAESLINNVLNAYRKGWQIVDIADFLGISEEQVKKILCNNRNTSGSSNKSSDRSSSVSRMSGFSKEDLEKK